MERVFLALSRLSFEVTAMEDILSLLIPVTFLLCLVAERVAPGRPLPEVRWWVLKGFLFFVVTGAINAVLPALAAPHLGWLTLVHGAKLGLPGATLVTLVTSELLSYWMHRAMHRFHFLWRWTHQMHHSAERVDIAGAVYFHPFDISLNVTVTTVAAALVGASPDAAALAGFATFAAAMFQHLNVRTPRWLGYVLQRPEGHSVHHQRGLHAYNYGNFSLWDLAFGTFRNPEGFSELSGFWDGGSARVGAMLLGRDVGTPPAPRSSDEQSPRAVPRAGRPAIGAARATL
jgi:sterol desaturase/sphingolipid hydroxylase (fatty acid hydroxylase superfamily)